MLGIDQHGSVVVVDGYLTYRATCKFVASEPRQSCATIALPSGSHLHAYKPQSGL